MTKKTKKNTPSPNFWSGWAFQSFKLQSLFLILVGFVFYFNSLQNEYALDDGIIIVKNEYVKKGVGGIKKILTTDAYDSYYRSMKAKQQLAGGRYRPLSMVTFAIEQSIFGDNYGENEEPNATVTFVRHLGNVLFYLFSVVLLLYFLRSYIFPEKNFLPFFICLLFLIHPLHTEVVANAKSRDEILSLLFITATFIFFFRYLDTNKKKHLVFSLITFFLAYLSKEYAITVLVLLPMLLYIKKGFSLKESLLKTVPFFLVTAVYMIMRIKFVGLGSTVDTSEVLNNPFLYAGKAEKWATQFWILMLYLKQLFYPVVMSSDYSYNTIPYIGFDDYRVWVSIAIHLSLIGTTVWLFVRRNILSFAFAFYLLHLALVSNFIFNIGATMGERLVYHSSFGLAVVLAMGGEKLLSLIPAALQKIFIAFIFLPLIFWCGQKTIERNAEWLNDNTLFTKDALKVPNSALANGNAGKAYVDLSEIPENSALTYELWGKGLYHLKRAIKIHPKYVNGYLNIGVIYFKLKQYDTCEYYWNKAKEIFPRNPLLKRNFEVLAITYYNEAMKIGISNPERSVFLLKKCTDFAPTNPDYWYNLGGAQFMIGKYDYAIDAWKKTLLLKPDYEDAKRGMMAAQAKLATR